VQLDIFNSSCNYLHTTSAVNIGNNSATIGNSSATIFTSSCNYLQQHLKLFTAAAATICNRPVTCCHFLHQKLFHNLQPIVAITETCDSLCNLLHHYCTCTCAVCENCAFSAVTSVSRCEGARIHFFMHIQTS
jgi:hypothetical protein